MYAPSEAKLQKTKTNTGREFVAYKGIFQLYKSLYDELSQSFPEQGLEDKKTPLPWKKLYEVLLNTENCINYNSNRSRVALLRKEVKDDMRSFFDESAIEACENTVGLIQKSLRTDIKTIKKLQKRFSPLGWQEKLKFFTLPLSVAAATYAGTVGVGSGVSGNSFLTVMKNTQFCIIPIFFAVTAGLLIFAIQRDCFLGERGLENVGLRAMSSLNAEYFDYQRVTNQIIEKIQRCVDGAQAILQDTYTHQTRELLTSLDEQDEISLSNQDGQSTIKIEMDDLKEPSLPGAL